MSPFLADLIYTNSSVQVYPDGKDVHSDSEKSDLFPKSAWQETGRPAYLGK